MMRNAITTRAPRPIAPSEVIEVDDLKKKSVYDWLAHLYLDPLGRHHSLYPPSLLAL